MNAEQGAWAVARSIVTFYAYNTTLYFRDIGGVITVVAAAFSLGKMVCVNELVAIIASGVSAKRIVGPILVLAIFFSALAVADQELLIPSISDKLVRTRNTRPNQESYGVWFITDGNGSLICSPRYEEQTSTFTQATIITRQLTARPGVWEVTGRISADLATYNQQTSNWDLVNGSYIGTNSTDAPKPVPFYHSPDLHPRDIAIRCKAEHNSLLSSRQLGALAAQQTRIKDMAQLLSQKHFRITDPIINLTMLMVSLPVLICRDPRTMKSAVLVSFGLTAACSVTTFVCKLFSTEPALFNRVMPEFWAWLPVFVFLPIAVIELDAMKT
jgi:lipopolysaccharide export LptBFGC system permease protein LptF